MGRLQEERALSTFRCSLADAFEFIRSERRNEHASSRSSDPCLFSFLSLVDDDDDDDDATNMPVNMLGLGVERDCTRRDACVCAHNIYSFSAHCHRLIFLLLTSVEIFDTIDVRIEFDSLDMFIHVKYRSKKE
jgi:hypothetical protein